MYTTMLLIALAGLPAANTEEAPVWLTDYPSARKQGLEEKKPLAVFVASGKDGWGKVARDGKLGKEMERLLADHYVCVHVNSSTAAGRKLAADLDVQNGLGLVISDRSGRVMAFHHQGDLANTSLAHYLKRFANPDHVVERTETNPTTTTRSDYPPAAAPTVPVITGGRGGC